MGLCKYEKQESVTDPKACDSVAACLSKDSIITTVQEKLNKFLKEKEGLKELS